MLPRDNYEESRKEEAREDRERSKPADRRSPWYGGQRRREGRPGINLYGQSIWNTSVGWQVHRGGIERACRAGGCVQTLEADIAAGAALRIETDSEIGGLSHRERRRARRDAAGEAGRLLDLKRGAEVVE